MSGEPKTLSGHVVSATAWNTLLLPVRFLVALVASVVYYRLLDLEQVGLLFLITSLAATLGLNADLGMERTLPRFLPEVERRHGRQGVQALVRRVIGVKLLILVGFVIGLALLQQPLCRFLAGKERAAAAALASRAEALGAAPDAAEQAASLRAQATAKSQLAAQIERQGPLFVAVVAALLVCGALYDVYMKVLTAYFKQRAWNAISIVVTLLQPLLLTAFILAGWGVPGVLLAIVLTPVLAVLLARAQARRVAQQLPAGADGQPLDRPLAGRFARYAGATYLGQLTTWLTDVEFVVFLAAALVGLDQVAVLGFAYKLARDFASYVATPLTGVATPLLTRVHQRGADALREGHASFTRLVWLLMVPAAVGLGLLAPRLVQTLYPKYAASSGLVLVFIACSFGDSLLWVSQQALVVAERYRAVLLSQLLCVLSLPLALALLPRYGLLGVALAVTLARLSARVLTAAYAVRRLRLDLPLDFGLRVLVASAAFVVVLAPLLRALPAPPGPGGPWTTLAGLAPLIALALLGAGIYLATLSLLGGLDPADRRRALELPLPFKSVLARLL